MTSMKKMAGILATVSTILASASGSAETVSYYYTNEQGSVLMVTNAAGAGSSTVDHKPYGADSLGANGSGPGYTGHFEDEDTSFIYMQARYYDGALGRFLSPDPVTPSNGGVFRMNRYAYGNDNPIANVDPDGRNTISDGRNTDPCSSAANVCTVDYQSGYGDPSPAPPRSAPDLSYLRTQTTPEDAYLFDPGTGIGAGTFLGPPSERDFNAIDIAAKRDSSNLIGKASPASISRAVGQGGTFDVQREGGTFHGSYTDASNYNAGFYMQRAGYGLIDTVALGSLYSMAKSSNRLNSQQRNMWISGWIGARFNIYPISVPNKPDVHDASR